MGKRKKKMSKDEQKKLIEFVQGKAKEKEEAKALEELKAKQKKDTEMGIAIIKAIQANRKEGILEPNRPAEPTKPKEPTKPEESKPELSVKQTEGAVEADSKKLYIYGGVGVLIIGAVAYILLRNPAQK